MNKNKGNPIREVPRTIRDCNCLETINFDFCNIDRLCSEITYCSRLLDVIYFVFGLLLYFHFFCFEKHIFFVFEFFFFKVEHCEK